MEKNLEQDGNPKIKKLSEDCKAAKKREEEAKKDLERLEKLVIMEKQLLKNKEDIAISTKQKIDEAKKEAKNTEKNVQEEKLRVNDALLAKGKKQQEYNKRKSELEKLKRNMKELVEEELDLKEAKKSVNKAKARLKQALKKFKDTEKKEEENLKELISGENIGKILLEDTKKIKKEKVKKIKKEKVKKIKKEKVKKMNYKLDACLELINKLKHYIKINNIHESIKTYTDIKALYMELSDEEKKHIFDDINNMHKKISVLIEEEKRKLKIEKEIEADKKLKQNIEKEELYHREVKIDKELIEKDGEELENLKNDLEETEELKDREKEEIAANPMENKEANEAADMDIETPEVKKREGFLSKLKAKIIPEEKDEENLEELEERFKKLSEGG